MKIDHALRRVLLGQDLSEEDMGEVFEQIMNGEVEDNDLVEFLNALRDKGESVSEIVGAAKVMRERAEKINVTGDMVVDTCGTGGTGLDTFNISTAAAFVVAGAGVKVAKHGNRAVSSQSGSADVLECLGVNINATVDIVEKCIEEVDIGFLFARNLHKAMKNAVNARQAVGGRTIFNLLGPLTNPAGVKRQVIGVFDKKWVRPIAEALKSLGSEHAFVVNGEDGMDEITLTHKTNVAELVDGEIKGYQIEPADFGFNLAEMKDLSGGSPQQNAAMIMDIFAGGRGSKRDIILVNAAAAIVAGGKAETLKEGFHMAQNSLDSLAARNILTKLGEVSFSGDS
jgi:anthranilate phosphoribosyltransferase